MIKQITNNGNNLFYVDLSQYDKVKLNGYLRADGYDLFNGVIYAELSVFIKDLDGNDLDVIYLENERKNITSSDQSGKGTIYRTVNQTIPLSQYKKYGSIIVDVYAYTQAAVSGIKGSGANYSHDINLKLDFIEIPKTIIPTVQIPTVQTVPKEITSSIVENKKTSFVPYSALIPLGIIGFLLINSRNSKK